MKFRSSGVREFIERQSLEFRSSGVKMGVRSSGVKVDVGGSGKDTDS